jgi:pre-mRNA-splicing factor SYF1
MYRRVKLFEKDPTRQLATYVEAVKIVDPMKTIESLWVKLICKDVCRAGNGL